MFLHLVPKILHPMGNLCTLDSVSVTELSLHLTGNDLVAMRPCGYAEGSQGIEWISGQNSPSVRRVYDGLRLEY